MPDLEKEIKNDILIPLIVDCPNCGIIQAVTIDLSNTSPVQQGILLQITDQCVSCETWYTITYNPQTDEVTTF